ncbi:MAG: outer membrane protein assembly factor BamA [Bacteroidia bacterium]|nr:outer membrane protein assembly factor BamA [Bacteroidia bacterium]
MKNALLISLFVCLIWAPLLAQVEIDYNRPTQYEIGGITVEGTEFSDKFAIVAYSGLKVGDVISIPGNEITDAIKKLWKQNIFSDVRVEVDNITNGKIFLVIRIGERPRISKFGFNKSIPKSQADDLREKVRFVRGTIYTPEKETRGIRVIRNYYVEKGYYNTKVNIISFPDSTMANGVELKIIVDKGPRIKVNKVRVEGNQEYSDGKLVRKMKDIKERRWWRVWSRSKYLPGKMNASTQNIVDFYNSMGYRDAKIISDTVKSYDDKSIDVELKIFEGQQYYYRNITWTGNYKYSGDSLGMFLGIEKGDVYNSEKLNRRLTGDPTGGDISSLYLDDGYLFFNVDPVEVLVEGDSIDIQMRVFEGPQATIGKIIIEGNTKTSDYVILRELRTLPGQKFSRSDLIRSQRNIVNLGYFNQENMNVLPIPDPSTGTVDIKYVVEERPSDQLQVQGGWGGRLRDPNTGDVIAGGFVGTVNLAFNNFSTKRFFKPEAWRPVPSGDGQKLTVGLQMNGVGWQNYFVSFLEPWLGGKKPNSLGASLSYSINRSTASGFQMKNLSTSIDFGKRLKIPDDYFQSVTSIGYKNYDLTNASAYFGSLSFEDGFINILTLKQAISRTSVDAPLYPRSGSTLSLSVEGTPPYSLFNTKVDYSKLPDNEKFKLLEYHKWSFTSTWYYSVFKNLVVRPQVRMGFLGTYNPDYGISPFERFNMGGSGFGQFNFFGQEFISMRGYKSNAIGPRGANGAQQGGSIFNKYSIELRYPLTLNQAAPIWVLGFLEAGNSWLGFKEYKPFELKRAAGGGIRVVVPMIGLLGVDLGYGFDSVTPTSGPSKWQFNFVIGQEF